jgi:hypothetical protein
MARVQPETVDKLIELLTLPIGENEDDERPQHLENDIQRVSQEFGWLVFEDDKWIEYDPSRIEDILQAWLDEETATRLDTAARESHARFLEWLENLVTDWKSQESGTQGPATEGGTFGPLGIANPHFEPDRVPGTEFYRYRDNEYVYAATADAPDDGWRTLEARVDEHRVTAPADGLLRGYPYTNSALPGTAYYRVEGETYLWVRSEEGHRGLGGDVAADGGSVAGPLRRRGGSPACRIIFAGAGREQVPASVRARVPALSRTSPPAESGGALEYDPTERWSPRTPAAALHRDGYS